MTRRPKKENPLITDDVNRPTIGVLNKKYLTRLTLHIFCVLALVIWTAGCTTSSSSSNDNDIFSTDSVDYKDAQLESRLDNAFETWVDDYGIYGAAIHLVSPDNLNYSNSTGYSNVENAVDFEEDTEVRIGSSTKPVTATVILQLIEEDRLSFDSTLSEFVTDYPNGDAITIELLLRHRSGIHEIQLDDMTFLIEAMTNTYKWFTPEEILSWTYNGDTYGPINSMSKGEEIPRGPVGQPGEMYHYSQPGYIALGLIIEIVTGKNLSDVFEERIFAPLNMTNTYLTEKDGSHDPIGYSNLFGLLDATIPTTSIVKSSADGSLNSLNSSSWCAGGLVSTAGDLFKFLYGLLNGELLSEASMANLQDWIVSSEDGYGLNNKAEYGMGFSRLHRDDYVITGHNGSLPGGGSVMQYIEDFDIYILAVRNTDKGEVAEGTPDLTEFVKMALMDELE